MRYEFGQWLPDLPPLMLQKDLTICKNVVPVAGGYAPLGALTNIDTDVVSAAPKGALRVELRDGTNAFFVGTDSTLERKTESGWSDVSKPAGYTSMGPRRWSIKKFGDDIFAANGSNPMQVMSISSETTFGDVPGAPRAHHLEVAENFLWAGDIFTSDLGVLRDGVQWSAINNGRFFPDPATDDATAVLSGRQILEGNGGIVNAVISGTEVVAIFQEQAVWRADFVGNDIVWQFNRIESDHGLAIKGAAIAVQRGALYIAEDGFRLLDYTRSTNIGKDKINDAFFADYDNDFPDSLSLIRDPQQTRIFISYAGTGHTDGVPNKLLIWDYVLDKWSTADPGDHHSLIAAGVLADSLDSPDTPSDPDLLGTGIPDVGSPGDESFDDRQLGASRIQVGAFDSSFRLSQFSGVPLSGVLETGDVEFAPGRRALLTAIRPHVDGDETSVEVAAFSRRADDTTTVDYALASQMAEDGNCYMRVDARYHRLRFNLSPYFTEATSYDAEFRGTGKR